MKIDRNDKFCGALFLGIGGGFAIVSTIGGGFGGYFVSSFFSDNTAVKIVSATGASLCSLGLCVGGSCCVIKCVIERVGRDIGEFVGKAIMHKGY